MSIQKYTQECYILLLKQAWLKKKEKNNRYSLRSFSRQTGISPGALSQILSGKRRVGTATARKIEQVLLSELKESLPVTQQVHEPVDAEALKKLRQEPGVEWYHMAIITLAKQYQEILSPEWIALHLSIDPGDASNAFSYLKDKGFLSLH